MTKIEKIYIFIIAVTLSSCSGKGQVFFIADRYADEILVNNIIEEIGKSAERSRFDFTYTRVDSENDFKSVYARIGNYDKGRIILTPFVFANYLTEDWKGGDPLFLIGPYFDLNRKNIEIIGNLESISYNSFSDLQTDSLSFYVDDSEKQLP